MDTRRLPPRGTDLRTRLREALTVALGSRDRVAMSALRSAIAAVDNAEAVTDVGHGTTARTTYADVAGSVAGLRATEVERRALTDAELDDVVRGEVTDRKRAADEYASAGRVDPADLLRREAQILLSVFGDRPGPTRVPLAPHVHPEPVSRGGADAPAR